MHEAPKYFRSDFMPREMERLAEREKEREKERERDGHGVWKRVARRALGQSTPPHVLAMRG